MQIVLNSVVSMHYRVATSEGEQVDASTPDAPLTFLHGHGQIIPGLEESLTGKVEGHVADLTIAPEKAYGVYDNGLDLRVTKDAFPAEIQPRLLPGFRFMAEHPTAEGQQVMFTVAKVDEQGVYVSGNHPLAGKTLLFHVEVVGVRAASAHELEHGHAHGGPGCGHHDHGGCEHEAEGGCGHEQGHDHGHEHKHGGNCGHQH